VLYRVMNSNVTIVVLSSKPIYNLSMLAYKYEYCLCDNNDSHSFVSSLSQVLLFGHVIGDRRTEKYAPPRGIKVQRLFCSTSNPAALPSLPRRLVAIVPRLMPAQLQINKGWVRGEVGYLNVCGDPLLPPPVLQPHLLHLHATEKFKA
jgi:hypothetical protein